MLEPGLNVAISRLIDWLKVGNGAHEVIGMFVSNGRWCVDLISHIYAEDKDTSATEYGDTLEEAITKALAAIEEA